MTGSYPTFVQQLRLYVPAELLWECGCFHYGWEPIDSWSYFLSNPLQQYLHICVGTGTESIATSTRIPVSMDLIHVYRIGSNGGILTLTVPRDGHAMSIVFRQGGETVRTIIYPETIDYQQLGPAIEDQSSTTIDAFTRILSLAGAYD